MAIIARIVTALVPLALTPLLLFAIAEGYLNFGGGEKDLFMLLPWMLWSFVFAIGAFVLWWRRWPHGRSLGTAAVFGFASLGLAGLILAVITNVMAQ